MRSLRFSIAGLMGVVLLAAIASAGLAQPQGPWTGILSLLTHGLIGLAVVGAICRSGAERVWWVGFASFGWIYLGRLFLLHSPYYPVHALLTMLAPLLGVPIEANPNFGNIDPLSQAFYETGHCLFALIAAVLGGFLASALFVARSTGTAELAIDAPPVHQEPRPWWVLPVTIVLSGLALTTSIAIICASMEPGIWAGATYLLTWWLIGLTALGALMATGRRREFWLGAAFLGVGFMLLIFYRPYNYDPREQQVFLPTAQFLEAIRPPIETLAVGLSGSREGIAARNARIRRTLKRRVPMQLTGKNLGDLLAYVKEVTKDKRGNSIPIYVDPLGLQEAEKNMHSELYPIDIKGIELATTLALCLKQLDLVFVVRDGLLVITSTESEVELFRSPYDDPYQIVGHCFLALIAAGLGGLAAPLVCNLARGRRE